VPTTAARVSAKVARAQVKIGRQGDAGLGGGLLVESGTARLRRPRGIDGRCHRQCLLVEERARLGKGVQYARLVAQDGQVDLPPPAESPPSFGSTRSAAHVSGCS